MLSAAMQHTVILKGIFIPNIKSADIISIKVLMDVSVIAGLYDKNILSPKLFREIEDVQKTPDMNLRNKVKQKNK